MAPTPLSHERSPAQDVVAANRVRFLTAETPEPRTVRDTILASWRRSLDMQVAADRIEMRFEPDICLDTRLSRSARPVLRALGERLQGQSVSVILTDPTGLVLSRLTGDSELERHLDQVLLAPGFSYAEKFVGTNGIGTALEVGGPAHVFGHEHYAEHLEDLACAGVPIRHPVTGRLVGAVDLTCWRRDAGSLLLALAKTTADQIRQAILADASASQLELFQEYLRTCSRRTGIVFALNSEVVMLNDRARSALSPADQAALLAEATEAITRVGRGAIMVELPSGPAARMYCRRVGSEESPSGLVAHVVVDKIATRRSVPGTTPSSVPLPSLVGSGAPWLRACQDLEQVFRSGEWVAVEGEPGVGKLAMLRAVQLRRQPVGRLVLIEAYEAAGEPNWMRSVREALAGETPSVVIRHVDALDGPRLRSLCSALQTARAARDDLWVAVTLDSAKNSKKLQPLLQLFPSTVEVPPLRMHIDDLSLLVPQFLSKLGKGAHLSCSPAAMRLLMRSSWPGNAAQLHDVLAEVVAHRRTGSIEPEDLPPEVHAVTRRVLSRIEAIERDAIVKSLADVNGNKLQAARALGMSRATIYRKIHDFGIVAPTA